MHYLMHMQHGVIMSIKRAGYRNSIFYSVEGGGGGMVCLQHTYCFSLGLAPV
jgi:hypothetical protein